MRASGVAASGLVALAAACSPGPGRDPVYPDASIRLRDAAAADAELQPDATIPDVGPYDGAVELPDAGPPPSYPMSGVFGFFDGSGKLYAREVDGWLSLYLGDFQAVTSTPYHYTGTISEDGEVETVSAELMGRGCKSARIYGRYDRASANFVLTHETCNQSGQPLVSGLTGGFEVNFDPARSGIFELQATVTGTGGCWEGPTSAVVRYGVDFIATGAMSVFCADDLLGFQQFYLGQGDREAFSALDSSFGMAITGAFTMVTALDPVRLRAERDAFDPVTGCGFHISLDGVRVELP